ncbi:MAG: hypothetical protein HYX79_08245 [Chloroflexi bacterium]|nr:hypothetical protein [Chloroflexota bacterium]
MPITRRQFELEIDPKVEEWMRSIHSFLTTSKNEAFTFSELWEALVGERTGSGLTTSISEDFRLALDSLLELGAVEKRKVRNLDYYSYGASSFEI